jgi:putative transcriptional regulator
MSSIGRVTETRSIYFTTDKVKRESVDGTAIVSCEELASIDDPDRIRELIRERADEPEN